jgi:hypothetical protein
MILLARLKPLVAVGAALILATAGVAVEGRQQPAPKEAREQDKPVPAPRADAGGGAAPETAPNRAIARKQLALIDDASATLRQLALNGKVSFSDPRFSLWGRRRLETLHKAGAGKAEIITALEKHIESLKADEAMAEHAHQSARGTILDVYDVQFRRMEAEIWLTEEKAR